MLLGKIYRIFEEIRRGANQARSKSGAEQKLSAPRLHNSQVEERVVEHVD